MMKKEIGKITKIKEENIKIKKIKGIKILKKKL